LMPNTRVRLDAALTAGIISGTCFQIVQWIYINFQIGAARYNAIYGSFAALPLFLAWVQISWIIVLIGAEISFAHQNAERFEFEPDARTISPLHKKRIALCMSHQIVHHFALGKPPHSAADLSRNLEIPIRIVHDILSDLVESNLFSIACGAHGENRGYQPAKDISGFTIADVFNALEALGSDSIHIKKTPALHVISEALESFCDRIESAPRNLLLKDI
jgi:membrane protein